MDHVTIVVPDIEEAQADFCGLGFADTEYALTGEHGIKSLVLPFVDGSSLHLISLPMAWRRFVLKIMRRVGALDRAFPNTVPPLRRMIEGLSFDNGLADYAVRVSAEDGSVQSCWKNRMNVDGGYSITQRRSDGLEVSFKILRLPDIEQHLPLILQDVTPQIMRIPAPENCYHVNGARGIAHVVIPVKNVIVARPIWEALFGPTVSIDDMDIADAKVAEGYSVGRSRIVLVEPIMDTEVMAWFISHGSRPFEVGLWVRHDLGIRGLPVDLAHGARVKLLPMPAEMADPAPWSADDMKQSVEARAAWEWEQQRSQYRDLRSAPDFKLPDNWKDIFTKTQQK